MRLLTFRDAAGAPRLGALDADDAVVDLTAAESAPQLASMLALIDAGADGLARAADALGRAPAGARRHLAETDLLAPLPVPRKIRDFLAFEGHLRNMAARMAGPGRDIPPVPPGWYERPIYAKQNVHSVVGTGHDVQWPPYSEELDYELELACVIGRGGKDIARADAMEHVFGYTIYNDVSARDEQRREWGPTGSMKGKDFDTGNILGPWIVTADELGSPYGLTMTARVNGVEWSRGDSGDMHHRFEDMIAFASLSETIVAGEVFGSGTCPTGCGAEQGRFPQPGDVVELEIERIGVLRNRYVKPGREES